MIDIQGQITELNFAPSGSCCVNYYPSKNFLQCAVMKIGEYHSDIPHFVLGQFVSHVMYLDQWYVSENICWIITLGYCPVLARAYSVLRSYSMSCSVKNNTN